MTTPEANGETRAGFARLVRYGMATAGPVGNAGSQFLLTLVMLRQLDAAAFGTFSFLLVLSHFGCGLWSALFCAPLPVLLHNGSPEERARSMRALLATNLVIGFLFAALFALVAFAFRLPTIEIAIYGAFGALTMLRWFARAFGYATSGQLRTSLSDILYATCLVGAVSYLFLQPRHSVGDGFLALLTSTFVSFLPFGLGFLKQQFLDIRLSDLPHYRAIWRQHARWALTGVITTEATVNAHAYVVTVFAGPNAFGPVAASALLTRPIGVVMSALTEFERPAMARHLGRGALSEVDRSIKLFRYVLLLVWLVTTFLAAAIIYWVPYWIFPAIYDHNFLKAGLALWMLVVLIRALRSPESAALQAAGVFRPLAQASIISCGVSLGASPCFSGGVAPSGRLRACLSAN